MNKLTHAIKDLARRLGSRLVNWADSNDAEVRPLQHRVRLLERAVEQASVSILITDEQGIIEYVNPAFECITEYSSEEAIGKSPNILNARTQEKEYYQTLWETISSGNPWVGQFHNLKKSGKPFWEHATISPIHDENGRIVNYVAVKEDITQLRQREIELQEACSKAKAADEAKSNFLATMSHELRTPLNTILGLASVIREQSISDDVRTSIEYINRSGEHLLKLIEDLLRLTYHPTSKAEPENVETDLLELLSDVLQSSANTVSGKQIEVQFDFSPNLPGTIRTDPTRLKQVLINLTENAIKYTQCGYVRLEVDGKANSENQVEMEFRIIDTGAGIAEESIERIFEPFFQVDSSNGRRYGGAGLGLAISKKIVERLGGTITASSILGRGTEFRFNLVFEAVEPQTLIYDTLRCSTLASKRIATTVKSTSLHQLLGYIAKANSMELVNIHPRELAESLTPRPDTLVASTEHESIVAELSKTQDCPPVLWHGESAAQSKNSIGLNPLPRALLGALKNAIVKLPTANAQREGQGRKTEKSQLAKDIPLSILSVDDIESNRKVIKVILNQLGYQANFATGGQDFLDLVSKNQYDLVLLDLQMPDLDGMTAFGQLLDSPPDHGLPAIVALTARADEATKNACLEAGMDGYLAKPVNLKKIADCIHSIFDNREPSPAPAETEGKAEKPGDILDLAHLESLVSEQPPKDAVRNLNDCIEALRLDIDNSLQEIQAASLSKDDETLIPVVHGLKGAAYMVGWKRLGDLCNEALQKLRAKAFADYESLHPTLLATYEETIPAIEAYLKQVEQTGNDQPSAAKTTL